MTAAVCAGSSLDLFKNIAVGVKIAQLFILDVSAISIDLKRRNRIFDNCVQQGIGEIHAVFIHQKMKLRHQAQSLGVAFEIIEISEHLWGEHFGKRFALEGQPRQVFPKPVPDRRLAEMSERRIADVMNQPGALYDAAHIRLHLEVKMSIPLIADDILRNVLPERARDRGHFQRVCQPGADKIALIQRKNLRLILQAPERRAADNAVVILFKFTS